MGLSDGLEATWNVEMGRGWGIKDDGCGWAQVRCSWVSNEYLPYDNLGLNHGESCHSLSFMMCQGLFACNSHV